MEVLAGDAIAIRVPITCPAEAWCDLNVVLTGNPGEGEG